MTTGNTGLGYCKYLAMARMAIAEEQYDDALEFYDLAISSSDAGGSVYYLKCELLFMLGREEEGVDLISSYAEQENNTIHIFYITSKHFEWRGKIDEASFWWEKYQNRVHGREHYFNDESTITKNHLSLVQGGADEAGN
jgi:tetratricopeptide (TPR) repeat protein